MTKAELAQRIEECKMIDEPCITYETGQRIHSGAVEFFVESEMHWPKKCKGKGIGPTLSQAISANAQDLAKNAAQLA